MLSVLPYINMMLLCILIKPKTVLFFFDSAISLRNFTHIKITTVLCSINKHKETEILLFIILHIILHYHLLNFETKINPTNTSKFDIY